MGVDGKLSAGYTPSKKTVHITIEPSSPSLPYFQALIAASENQMTPFEVSLIINIKSMPKTYTYVNGYLTTAKRLPDLKQVLDPVTSRLTSKNVSNGAIREKKNEKNNYCYGER